MAEGEVSVRELRQNLSVYLRQVRRGATLAVTSRGERVAVLSPIGGGSTIDRLIAEGRIAAPEQPWRAPQPVRLRGAGRRPLTDALVAAREEEDR